MIYENELWWQQNGYTWDEEVDRRRGLQLLYSIQEVVLSQYFSLLPEGSKVMEFGVGFGRHLDYLAGLSNIELYGVDQSPTMLEKLRERMADRPDITSRIKLIDPRHRLPYPDNYFDVTYTVSVLIHIRPEHLQEIMSELIRVTKHAVIHFENNYTDESEFAFPDHNGCWRHSIVSQYAKQHVACEVLQKTSEDQGLYFAMLSNDNRFKQLENPALFSRLHMMEQRVQPQLRIYEGEVNWRTQEIIKLTDQIKLLNQKLDSQEGVAVELRQDIDRLTGQNSKLSQHKSRLTQQLQGVQEQLSKTVQNEKMLSSNLYSLQTELDVIRSSFAWRLISKYRNTPVIYKMGSIIRKALKKMKKLPISVAPQNHSHEIDFSLEQIKHIPPNVELAIHHPDWLGVTNSTQELFEYCVGIRDLYNSTDVELIGTALLQCRPKKIVFSGFANGYGLLARFLKKAEPSLTLLIFWHGNTTHMYEDYSWIMHQEIINLCHDGVITGWGFAKKSMVEVYSRHGYPAFFVANKVTAQQMAPRSSVVHSSDSGVIKLGLYASGTTWNKNAYTQIAAASLIQNSVVRAIPMSDRMKAFANQMNVEIIGENFTVSRHSLLEHMSHNDVNLYVTFSECAPLFPLESLTHGIPCLTGPNHHYFNGSPLQEYLVVDHPDNPVEIAKKITVAHQKREEISKLFEDWKLNNEVLVQKQLSEFLGR